jgi:WD40 repeat protein
MAVPGDLGTPSAELYDPGTKSFARTGDMKVARWGHTATLLRDGRVLIAGGSNRADLPSAELYDPATRTFSATGGMIENRSWHAATLLPDGKVLIVGGERGLAMAADAEVYDPETATFSLTGGYAQRLKFFGFTNTANSLPDGRILVIGENPPEIYNPTSGTFRTTGTMIEPSYFFGVEWQTSTSLRDGTVLITGGNDDETCGGFANAEIYDPTSGTFSATEGMTTTREIHTATLLRDGSVLLAGGGAGWCGTPSNDTAELYDPAKRSFVAVERMTRSRTAHTATLLDDGTVLIAGGYSYWPATMTDSAELYLPVAQPTGRQSGRR